MTKKPYWHGYKDAKDYFTNAPDDLLQKHYLRIKDFEAAMIFTKAMMQYRDHFPLLQANGAIYDQLGLKVNSWDI